MLPNVLPAILISNHRERSHRRKHRSLQVRPLEQTAHSSGAQRSLFIAAETSPRASRKPSRRRKGFNLLVSIPRGKFGPRKSVSFLLMCWLFLAGAAFCQETPTPTPITPSASATAVPVADIAAKLDTTQALLDGVAERLQADDLVVEIGDPLTELIEWVDKNTPEVANLLAQNPSLSSLRETENGWKQAGSLLPDWKRRLNDRNRQLELDLQSLNEAQKSWDVTLQTEQGSALPEELTDRIRGVLQQAKQASERASRSQAKLLVLLTRLSSVAERVGATVTQLQEARRQKVARTFQHDAPPIWQVDWSPLASAALYRETFESLAQQLDALSDYVSARADRFFLHLILLGSLYAGVRWARRRVTSWAELEPSLSRPVGIFNHPLSTSLLLSVLLTGWVYPNPPILLQTLIAATGLLPAVAVLKRLFRPDLHPTLYVLVGLFCVDQVRSLTTNQPLLTRAIFTLQILMAFLYLISRILMYRRASSVSLGQRARAVAVAILGFSLLAMVLGFVALGYLCGEAALQATYLAVVLYSLLQIVDALVMLSLRTPPLSLLASVQNARHLFYQRINLAFRYLTGFFWVGKCLDALGAHHAASDAFFSTMGWSLQLGAVHITLGGVLGLAICLWVPMQLSRFVRFVFDQDLYPRLSVSSGATYTLSTLVHYTLLVGGVLFGVAAVGIDMTKFTIVASALGVGIGFGLQNIVNNFVSGIILLFERPVEVGHFIDVSGQSGTLQRVGLRASILRTADGSEVIIPNGELLSTRVTNWTFSDPWRQLRIPVGVAYGSDPGEVTELLLKIAEGHESILSTPAPSVLFMNLGESSLDFEFRAWTAESVRWISVRSELLTQIYAALNEAGIGIPFPQRSLRVESWPPKTPDGNPLP